MFGSFLSELWQGEGLVLERGGWIGQIENYRLLKEAWLHVIA